MARRAVVIFLLTMFNLAPARGDWTAQFSSATDVAFTQNGFVAPDEDLIVSLNFAPEAGTALTVVDNTALALIEGEFPNLHHGDVVTLGFAGISYYFVANYVGGSGNDLVLQWLPTKMIGWGDNRSYKIDGALSAFFPLRDPVEVGRSELVDGRWMLDGAIAADHSLLLAADGSAVARGGSSVARGVLGHGATIAIPARVPVSVLTNWKLIAIDAGARHSLALRNDGTVLCWGVNADFQLGRTGLAYAELPVLPDTTGALGGKTVVAIAAGEYHNLALCSDGSLIAWGRNTSGQAGTGVTSPVVEIPAAVEQSGVLAGKMVVRIATGASHCLVLCSDGTLASWGNNSYGQLGDGTTNPANLPVAVDLSGVLSGRTVVDIACGGSHSLALCSDGTVASWGRNSSGQLGVNSPDPSLPALVDQTGVLAGKAVVAVSAGTSHSVFLCSDGTVAASGANNRGQLGDATLSSSPVPVLSSASTPPGGGRVVALRCGADANLAMAVPISAPEVESLPATPVSSSSAVLNGRVNPVSNPTTPSFDFGTDATYGTAVVGGPDPVGGLVASQVSGLVSGLAPETTYYFRASATNPIGTSAGGDMTFTTLAVDKDAHLSGLIVDVGSLTPAFPSATTRYRVSVPESTTAIVPTATTSVAGAMLEVNGAVTSSGTPAPPIPLGYGDNRIPVRVVATDGDSEMSYELIVLREPPESWTWNIVGESSVGAVMEGFTATGMTIVPSLGFAPPVGADLTLIRNTSVKPIEGELTNLTQGQSLELEFGGSTYPFVVNYHGGDGNDLVLRWAINRVAAWGRNDVGQLVDGTRLNRPLPDVSGPPGFLADVTVLAGEGLVVHCSDGSLRTWGPDGAAPDAGMGTPAGVRVEGNGALAGREIARIEGCRGQIAVLPTDGGMVMRGLNWYGNIGNGVYLPGQLLMPDFTEVDRSGVLAGRRVVSMSVSLRHSYALCDDGRIVAWGRNDSGQLGNDADDVGGYVTNSISSVTPTLVLAQGALGGKSVVKVEAGLLFGVALCSDGTLAAWGRNYDGQLGDGTNVNSMVPVEVDRAGVLAGKTVVDVVAGNAHSLALCSDGTIAAWGSNGSGFLGDGSTTSSWVPVQVVTDGAMAGKVVTKIAASGAQSFALCADGSLYAWGSNAYGDLGDGTFTDSSVPVAVSTANLGPGARIVDVIADKDDTQGTLGDPIARSVAVVAFPPPSSPIDFWKLAELGDAYVSDLRDLDFDGLPLLVEYGLVLEPEVPERDPLGELVSYPDGDRLAMSLIQDPARSDVTIVVEVSSNLADDWATVASSVNGAAFSGPGVVRDEEAGGGRRSVEIRDLVSPGPEAPARFIRARVVRW